MQFSNVALLALAAHLTSAQVTIADLPSCALTAGLSAISSTGCSATDIACVCNNTAFVTKLTAAVKSSCSAADQAKTITAAISLCAQAGVTLEIPGGVSLASTTAETTTSVEAVESVSSVASSVVSSSPTPSSNVSISVTASPTPTSTFTGGAGLATLASYAGAGLLGVAAMFAF